MSYLCTGLGITLRNFEELLSKEPKEMLEVNLNCLLAMGQYYNWCLEIRDRLLCSIRLLVIATIVIDWLLSKVIQRGCVDEGAINWLGPAYRSVG